jgi:hypothetical protein
MDGGSRGNRLLRREILLPLLAFLVLSAPLSCPAYTSSVLLINYLATLPAHLAFLRYQHRCRPAENGGCPVTVVNSLMFLLSFIIQLAGMTAVMALLLRLVAVETSLGWYQTYPGIACSILFPRYILYTDKKEKKIFLIYKEIQMGLGAKSCMRKGFLIYEEMRKYLVIYEEAVSHV